MPPKEQRMLVHSQLSESLPMTTENTIKLVARTNGHTPAELHSALNAAYEQGSLRKPDFGSGPAMVSPPGDEAPQEVNLFVTVLADDDEELVAAVESVMNSLRLSDVELVGSPMLHASNPVRPVTVTADGVDYDEAAGVLYIDTWAPTWGDLEVRLHPKGDGRVIVMIADHISGHCREQAVIVNTIAVRRPGGAHPAQPPGL